jgi:Lrp/AsnC family leucine-responsive transcriptional regulator
MIVPMAMDLDEIDWKILQILQENAAIPNIELADEIGLSPAPCHRRVKRLKDLGVIKRSIVELDYEKLGYSLTAFVEVTLAEHTEKAAREFIRAVRIRNHIVSCHMVTGDYDFILRIMAPDIASYRTLVWEELHAIKGVHKMRSSVVLETTKDQLGPTLNIVK